MEYLSSGLITLRKIISFDGALTSESDELSEPSFAGEILPPFGTDGHFPPCEERTWGYHVDSDCHVCTRADDMTLAPYNCGQGCGPAQKNSSTLCTRDFLGAGSFGRGRFTHTHIDYIHTSKYALYSCFVYYILYLV